jgi:hypothetical protein
MRILSCTLALCFVGSTLAAQTSDPAKVSAYLKTLPTQPAMAFDEARREQLAASGISCSDHPQEAPVNRNDYLWLYTKQPQILDGYDKSRAFFGCANWHDAVATVWMLMATLREEPKISLASDIKDIATTHFRKANIDGEYAFFNGERVEPGANHFEQPYGYSWLLKLYGEVKGSNSEDAKKMATALAPLAKWMSERYVFYLYDLKFPYRTGIESNTAWGMSLALDGANLSENETLKTAIHSNAIRLFGKDKHCATSFEPQNSDLISSCLTEAALMGRVMPQADYLKWLDEFLPPVYSDGFQEYIKEVDISHINTSGPDAQVQRAAEAHLIGLNFQRATEMLTISWALPKEDSRVAVLRNLARACAWRGYEKIGAAGYEGQHLLHIYAQLYEDALQGPAPLAPPQKPKEKKDGSETVATQSGN